MKKLFAASVLVALFALSSAVSAAEQASPEQAIQAGESAPEKGPPFATRKETLSYSIGADMAMRFKRARLEVDLEVVLKGFTHALLDEPMLLTEIEIGQALRAFQQEMVAKRRELSLNNQTEGDLFLEKNKEKEGVITLESGLQYEVLKEGTGENPSAEDTVVVHYRGTLLDGTEFDSSYKGGKPASFKVGRVIRGWTEALQLMKVGAKWKLYIPSKLAYGNSGSGPIGPNSMLVFEVELLEIEK